MQRLLGNLPVSGKLALLAALTATRGGASESLDAARQLSAQASELWDQLAQFKGSDRTSAGPARSGTAVAATPRLATAAAALACLLGSLPASAAEAPGPGDLVLPCRPTVACTAEISAPGQLEIEAGFQHRSVTGSRIDSTPVLFKLSLTEWFQLQIGTPGLTYVSGAPGQSYFDASQLLGKVAFPLGEGRPTVGATVAVNLPTAAGTERRTDALFALLASQDLVGFHADLNLGLNLLAIDQVAQPQGWGALSISHDLPLNLIGMVEGWHSTAAGPISGRDGGFLFALGWSPVRWVTLDVGGDVALFAGDRSFSAFVGITFVPVDLWGGPSRRERARTEGMRLAESASGAAAPGASRPE